MTLSLWPVSGKANSVWPWLFRMQHLVKVNYVSKNYSIVLFLQYAVFQIYGMEARRYSLSKKPLYCKLHLIPSQTEIFAPFKSWGDLLLAIFNWFKFHRWSDIDDIIASWLSAVFSMTFWSRLWFLFFIGNITEIKGLVQACWYVLCLWKW